jgi:hypothetical protein
MTPYRSRDAALEADLSTARAHIEELEKRLGIDAWTRARAQSALGAGRRRLALFGLWLAGVAVAAVPALLVSHDLHEENRTLQAEVDRTARRVASTEAELAAVRDHPSVYFVGDWKVNARPREPGCPLARFESTPLSSEYRELGVIVGAPLDDTDGDKLPADLRAIACEVGADAIVVQSGPTGRMKTLRLYAKVEPPLFVLPALSNEG